LEGAANQLAVNDSKRMILLPVAGHLFSFQTGDDVNIKGDGTKQLVWIIMEDSTGEASTGCLQRFEVR
jgi:hypothetical protein